MNNIIRFSSIALIQLLSLSVFANATNDEKAVEDIKFTIKAGAVLETLYFNASDADFSTSIKAYEKLTSKYGGELLGKFKVEKKTSERPVTHIAIVQWASTDKYDEVTKSRSFNKVKEKLVDVTFYASQNDTPVTLKEGKMYDFTSAFTIMTDPCQMPIIMQVLQTYFGKIGPAMQKYSILQTAFVGPHPGAPQTTVATYTPHMMGIFEWSAVSDVDKFQADKGLTEHVDIRNAIMSKMDHFYTKVIL